MFSLPNPTLINTKIAQFYKINTVEELVNFSAYFYDNGTFNSSQIVKYLWPNQETDEIFKGLEYYKYEDFLQCYNKLLPIFQHADKILTNMNENDVGVLKIQWMGNNANVYLAIRNSYCKNNNTETFEHVLILTSLLANALTNVFLSQTQEKHAPHLLKDLINSAEIIKIFGLEMVLILKIFMGSPNSINLRNIVWHGFPKPMEIPIYYASFLLITIHSLGCIIEEKNLQLKQRFQITKFNDHIKVIEKDITFKPKNLEYIELKLQQIEHDFKPYWQQLLCHYKSQKYIQFIILVLPQIELLLRLHYGRDNNFDISAKLDEYYITMDTIFETLVPKDDTIHVNSNKLLDFEIALFESCFHLLYDIFISPNGCRLRDKVSHGEVFLEALNNPQLCSLVLQIFCCLLFPQDFKLFDNYESKLHLNCTTKVELNKCLEKLKMFNNKHLANKQDLPLKPITLNHQKALIFKRPKKEPELMLLISKISEKIYKTMLNYEESIAMKSALLAQRELHSKRRKTLEKLLTALPHIFRTLFLIASCISRIFSILQNKFDLVLEGDDNYEKTLRFLKHCLTISENFVKYSHCESNEWIKSLELCRKYDDFHKKLFLYDD